MCGRFDIRGGTYVIRDAARVIQKRAKPRTVADTPEASLLHGARRLVKNARMSKMRARR